MPPGPLVVYRGLLRATRRGKPAHAACKSPGAALTPSCAAFPGDARTLAESRQQIRDKFRVRAGAQQRVHSLLGCTDCAPVQESAGEQDPATVQQLCADGVEAADFLQTYVVQGKVRLSADCSPQHPAQQRLRRTLWRRS